MRTCIAVTACLVAFGLAAPTTAATFFHDNFEDGSATDGQPVSWVAPGYAQTGTRVVQDGSLVLTAASGRSLWESLYVHKRAVPSDFFSLFGDFRKS